jgi:hypothetical protein
MKREKFKVTELLSHVKSTLYEGEVVGNHAFRGATVRARYTRMEGKYGL